MVSVVEVKLFTDAEVEEMTKEAAISPEELKKKRTQEVDLLGAFHKAPSKATFMPLYQSFKPFIMKAAKKNMYGSPLPQAAHMALAAQSFLDATRTWDKSKGPFASHAFNTVSEKGKRLNLKYQNIGYIPEARATKYQSFQTAQYLLRENLGREPSTVELADEMSMPPAEIERMRKEIKQDLILKENLPNAGPAFAQSDKTRQVYRDIQYSLTPKHRLILEHAVGLNGLTPLSKSGGGPDVQALAHGLKLSVPEIRSGLKAISRHVKEFRGSIGQAGDLDHFVDEEESQ